MLILSVLIITDIAYARQTTPSKTTRHACYAIPISRTASLARGPTTRHIARGVLRDTTRPLTQKPAYTVGKSVLAVLDARVMCASSVTGPETTTRLLSMGHVSADNNLASKMAIAVHA